MVLRTSIISESEVYIHYGSLSAMFTLLHSSMNQGLFEKYICNQSSHYEKYDGAKNRLKLKDPLPFSVSYVWLVVQKYESRTAKHLCNQSSHDEKYNVSLHEGSHHMQPPN